MPEPTRPRQVSNSHFKAHARQLFREIEATGQPLVVTDHGRPTLEIRPCRPADLTPVDPRKELRGSVLRFDDPFAPVAEGDWDALA
ncbi:MAG: type II toxin-antitoxin system Phd/YefM family antitoxin [Cyanobacteriota bacterium]|nr:type II toxin-antitoxin system Phd/YefM family antitoxin [Cyanobacteriota bacterium]